MTPEVATSVAVVIAGLAFAAGVTYGAEWQDRQVMSNHFAVPRGFRIAIIVALLATAVGLGSWAFDNSPTVKAYCAEDDPCWDCNTHGTILHGNRICGPTTKE